MWWALSCFPIWLISRKAWRLQGHAGRAIWQKRRQYPSLKYFSYISAVWIPADETSQKLGQFYNTFKFCLTRIGSLVSHSWIYRTASELLPILLCTKNFEKDYIADFSFCIFITFKIPLNLCFCCSVGSCTLQLTTFQILSGFILYSKPV